MKPPQPRNRFWLRIIESFQKVVASIALRAQLVKAGRNDHGLLFAIAVLTFISGFTVSYIHRDEIP